MVPLTAVARASPYRLEHFGLRIDQVENMGEDSSLAQLRKLIEEHGLASVLAHLEDVCVENAGSRTSSHAKDRWIECADNIAKARACIPPT